MYELMHLLKLKSVQQQFYFHQIAFCISMEQKLSEFAHLVNKSTGRIGPSRMHLTQLHSSVQQYYKYQHKLSLLKNFLTP